jgi:hypothetical protein
MSQKTKDKFFKYLFSENMDKSEFMTCQFILNSHQKK